MTPQVLSGFHPAVVEWFRSRFPAPTEAQARAWAVTAQRGVSLMNINPIKTKDDYNNALARVAQLMDTEPGPSALAPSTFQRGVTKLPMWVFIRLK